MHNYTSLVSQFPALQLRVESEVSELTAVMALDVAVDPTAADAAAVAATTVTARSPPLKPMRRVPRLLSWIPSHAAASFRAVFASGVQLSLTEKSRIASKVGHGSEVGAPVTRVSFPHPLCVLT